MTDVTAVGTAGTDGTAAAAAKAVLVALAAAQFVIILDSSVMNVSIATVAKDLDTTVTGIQTAITLYTPVMASLMITGGKMGAILGRKRAFTIGCVIYACGSFTTALSTTPACPPQLPPRSSTKTPTPASTPSAPRSPSSRCSRSSPCS